MKSSFDRFFVQRLGNSKYWPSQLAREVEFRSVFRAPSQKFKILVIPNVLAHSKSYEHCFMKKCDGHKISAMSRVKSSFDRFSVHHLEIQNDGHSQSSHGKSYEHSITKKQDDPLNLQLMSKATREVEFRLVFRSPSRKFKILAIPNVLAHGKSYEQGIVKKCNVHRLCAMSRAKSSFDRVFMHHLRKSKYRPFETY
ncbi:hypothetical protein GW17_00040939 [Ensete ventricosum]|nr:hypothetical protein GW17_00040939 [Ensete ventricosum]